jgi:hypothetical protein
MGFHAALTCIEILKQVVWEGSVKRRTNWVKCWSVLETLWWRYNSKQWHGRVGTVRVLLSVSRRSAFPSGLMLSYIPQRFELFRSSPRKHRRIRTPEFPPGMEFNLVRERWKKEGMEDPFLERQVFGASRPAEVPLVRRSLFSVPIVTSQLPQSDKRTVSSAFGKVGWS